MELLIQVGTFCQVGGLTGSTVLKREIIWKLKDIIPNYVNRWRLREAFWQHIPILRFYDQESLLPCGDHSNVRREVGKYADMFRKKFEPLIHDRALYTPNPFYQFNIDDDNTEIVSRYELLQVDGAEDGQNVPLQPLLLPERELEAIIAFDFSVGFHNWPSSIAIAIGRTFQKFVNTGHRTPFPKVPDFNVRSRLKLLFLGCSLDDYEYREYQDQVGTTSTPLLIIYIPSSEYNVPANTSTQELLYNHTFMSQMMQNGYNVVTWEYLSEADWDQCVACGLLNGGFDDSNISLEIRNDCFDSYCCHE